MKGKQPREVNAKQVPRETNDIGKGQGFGADRVDLECQA